MKKYILVLLAIIGIDFDLRAQPSTSDTVVCIIDTAKCYVKYIVNPFVDRNPKYHWQVSIKGHYYDNSRPNYKDFAYIVFNADDLRSIYESGFKGLFSIRMTKKKIVKSFVLETDEWINQQTDERKLRQRIGAYPSFKYNFIIFKKDFENAANDSVTMYRVAIGYNEVQD